MNEREFGHQIKRHLDRGIELEPATLRRLKLAREQALARQRLHEPAFALAWAGNIAGRFAGTPLALRFALAAAALMLALLGIHASQQTPSVEEVEEIDAALLTSDLPINAYLDKSFDTWLKRSQH